jgi:acyl carrier protein
LKSTDVQKKAKTEDAIAVWITSYMARLLNVPEADVDQSAPFERFGVDSMTAMTMIADLGDWIGTDMQPTLIYDYPTISALANHLAGAGGADKTSRASKEPVLANQ